ncbi:hypothetical protein HAX54_003790 [Datura stramonium]|uniref:Uncharacterized protein n=1 Tax=Datura stramonium TaxID=4076 RepID=A0ABS8WSE9_DATST|nr:hypothetical protein [Datura stramonium]
MKSFAARCIAAACFHSNHTDPKASGLGKVPQRAQIVGDGRRRLQHRWDDICAFRVFPYKCQISLQLCELKDDYIQQEIRKPSKEEACNSATGWFSFHTLDCLRRCIDVRLCQLPLIRVLIQADNVSEITCKSSLAIFHSVQQGWMKYKMIDLGEYEIYDQYNDDSYSEDRRLLERLIYLSEECIWKN